MMQVQQKELIAEIKPNGSVIVHSIINVATEESSIEYVAPFSAETTSKIEEGKAIANADALTKNNEMEGCQIIADESREINNNNKLHSKKQISNIPSVAEEIVLLELIKVIETKG